MEAEMTNEAAERVMGSDAARAVGRFRPEGVLGYRAATAPTPIRATREEAVQDEHDWLEGIGVPVTSRRSST